jgi:hypothetical protein
MRIALIAAVVHFLKAFCHDMSSRQDPRIIVTISGYEASLPVSSGRGIICINHQGRTRNQVPV